MKKGAYDQLQLILDTIPHAICWIDKENRYLGCNQQYLSKIGFSSKDHLFGKSIFDFLPADQHPNFIKACEKIWGSKEPLPFRGTIINHDGKRNFFNSIIQLLRNNNKKIGFLIIEQDIKLSKPETNPSSKNEIYFKNIIEYLPASIYWKDRDCIIIGDNLIHAQLCGFSSPEEVIGKTDYDFPWHEAAETVIANDQEVMNTRKTCTFEETGAISGGKVHTFLTKKAPLIDDRDNVIGLLGVSIDITKQKKAEEELLKAKKIIDNKSRDLEIYLNNIIKHIPASVYWKDKNCVIIGDNIVHAKLCGFSSPEEVIGKTDYDFPWKEEAAAIIANDHEVMNTGKTQTFEELATMTDGTLHTFLTKKTPMIDGRGEVVGLLGISLDVSEQKNLEEKLRTTEASEARFKAMSALGGMIAHELRTPLTTIGWGIFTIQNLLPKLIQGYEKSVRQGGVEEIPQRLLKGMEKSIDNLGRAIKYAQTTITTVLSGFHYTDNNVKIRIIPFSLKSMLDKALAEYPFDLEEEEWVTVKHIDDVQVLGEEQMVVHVLYNLLKNALHAIHAEGKGAIFIWSEISKAKVCLYIEDTAKGMLPEQLSRIFEAFYTTKEETAVSIGLGLYFCKMILQKMNADIACESELGKYARFRLILPLTE